jgi:hypothetical protein
MRDTVGLCFLASEGQEWPDNVATLGWDASKPGEAGSPRKIQEYGLDKIGLGVGGRN